jgi:hypothetical protein
MMRQTVPVQGKVNGKGRMRGYDEKEGGPGYILKRHFSPVFLHRIAMVTLYIGGTTSF